MRKHQVGDHSRLCRPAILLVSILATFWMCSVQGAGPTRGRVNADSLNVRIKPYKSSSTQGCVVGNAKELSILESTSNGRWYKVDVSKIKGCESVKTGWVYGAPYFEPILDTASGYVVEVGKGLNVRGSPGSQGKKLCVLKNGAPVQVVGPAAPSSRWLKVDLSDEPSCGEKYGYIYDKYVREIETVGIADEGEEIDTGVAEGLDPEATESETEAANSDGCTDCGSGAFTQNALGVILSASDALSYSQSVSVNKMIAHALKSKRKRTSGYCYRFVKRALLASGLVSRYLPGRSAKLSGKVLEKEGFINLMANSAEGESDLDPFRAPRGAILVYDGGRHGHIEVKVGEHGEGGFVSDYYSESARTGPAENGVSGRGRRLIGIYVKPGVS